MRELVRTRARRVDPDRLITALAPGDRLLAYYPDLDLQDGAAEQATNGFLDVHNTPPWDTWIALLDDPEAARDQQSFLLSFVPANHVPIVDRAIDVNPESCICWADLEQRQQIGI